jgi:hypothetical protein
MPEFDYARPVYSSSATMYGTPPVVPISETTRLWLLYEPLCTFRGHWCSWLTHKRATQRGFILSNCSHAARTWRTAHRFQLSIHVPTPRPPNRTGPTASVGSNALAPNLQQERVKAAFLSNSSWQGKHLYRMSRPTLSPPCIASSNNIPARTFRILLTSDVHPPRHPLLPTPRQPCNRLTRRWTRLTWIRIQSTSSWEVPPSYVLSSSLTFLLY